MPSKNIGPQKKTLKSLALYFYLFIGIATYSPYAFSFATLKTQALELSQLREPDSAFQLQGNFLELFMVLFEKGLLFQDDIKGLKLALKSWHIKYHNDLRFLLLCAQDGTFFPEDAFKYLENLAEAKNLLANIILGSSYIDNSSMIKDNKKALKYLKEATDLGSHAATFLLGWLHFEEHNEMEELAYTQKAASQGFAKAQYNLALWYLAKDPNLAIKYLQEAAHNGLILAQFYLGELYELGKEVTQNYAEAKKYYEQAADQGFRNAQYNLGLMHLLGNGVPQDLLQGIKYIKLAAESGYLAAQFCLGEIYTFGRGIPQDLAEGAKYFRQAADQGYPDAQYQFGTMLFHGHGVLVDEIKAIQYIQNASDNKQKAAQSFLSMYLCVESQKNADDQQKSAELLKKSQELLKLSAQQNFSEAQLGLGFNYRTGEGGFDQNYQKAVKYLKKSADQGDPDAQYALGGLLLRGVGIAHDDALALSYYEKSSAQENSGADYYIGQIYWQGIGVKQDKKKALEYFLKGAEKEEERCLIHLGELHLSGDEVEKSLEKALQYFQRALNKENQTARYYISALKIINEGGNIDKIIELPRVPEDQDETILAEILFFIGEAYERGILAPQNYKKAVSYYQQSIAHNKHRSASIGLAVFYADAKGIGRDETQAFKIFADSYAHFWCCCSTKIAALMKLTQSLFVSKNIAFEESQSDLENLSGSLEEVTYGALSWELIHQDQNSTAYSVTRPFRAIGALYQPLLYVVNNLKLTLSFLPNLKAPMILITCVDLLREPLVDNSSLVPYFKRHKIGEHNYISFGENNVLQVDNLVSFLNNSLEAQATVHTHDLFAQLLASQFITRINPKISCVDGAHKTPDSDLNFGDLLSIVEKTCVLLEQSGHDNPDFQNALENIARPLLHELKNYRRIHRKIMPALIRETASERNQITQKMEFFRVFNLLQNI